MHGMLPIRRNCRCKKGESMIEISHLSKTYDLNSSQVHAVNDVSFSIGKGEVFGVIG